MKIVNSAIWYTWRSTFLRLIALTVTSECLTIFNAFFIGQIIKFVVDLDMPTSIGVQRVAIFVVTNAVSILVRHHYVQGGMDTCLFLRRTLVATMFKKILKLSLKSLVETDSGKLVAIISADLFVVERQLAMVA